MDDVRQSVFRKAAIDRLTSPDELTEALSITRPVDWLILCALALVMAGAIVWGMSGQIPATATDSGEKVSTL